MAGERKAVGYKGTDKVVESIRNTPKAASKIKLAVEVSGKELSSNDIVFVHASVVDENETTIPDVKRAVQFSVTNGTLIGSNPVTAEAGIATIFLTTDALKNIVFLKAFASGLQSDSIELVIKKLILQSNLF